MELKRTYICICHPYKFSFSHKHKHTYIIKCPQYHHVRFAAASFSLGIWVPCFAFLSHRCCSFRCIGVQHTKKYTFIPYIILYLTAQFTQFDLHEILIGARERNSNCHYAITAHMWWARTDPIPVHHHQNVCKTYFSYLVFFWMNDDGCGIAVLYAATFHIL